MEYRTLILPRAQRQISSLPLEARKRISDAIDSLEKTPRPPGVKKLKGAEDLYRIPVGKDAGRPLQVTRSTSW